MNETDKMEEIMPKMLTIFWLAKSLFIQEDAFKGHHIITRADKLRNSEAFVCP